MLQGPRLFLWGIRWHSMFVSWLTLTSNCFIYIWITVPKIRESQGKFLMIFVRAYSWEPCIELGVNSIQFIALHQWSRNICWCPVESSDLAGHFVQQISIHIECPTRKPRMTTVICQLSTGKIVWQRLKMSGTALKTCRTKCQASQK